MSTSSISCDSSMMSSTEIVSGMTTNKGRSKMVRSMDEVSLSSSVSTKSSDTKSFEGKHGSLSMLPTIKVQHEIDNSDTATTTTEASKTSHKSDTSASLKSNKKGSSNSVSKASKGSSVQKTMNRSIAKLNYDPSKEPKVISMLYDHSCSTEKSGLVSSSGVVGDIRKTNEGTLSKFSQSFGKLNYDDDDTNVKDDSSFCYEEDSEWWKTTQSPSKRQSQRSSSLKGTSMAPTTPTINCNGNAFINLAREEDNSSSENTVEDDQISKLSSTRKIKKDVDSSEIIQSMDKLDDVSKNDDSPAVCALRDDDGRSHLCNPALSNEITNIEKYTDKENKAKKSNTITKDKRKKKTLQDLSEVERRSSTDAESSEVGDHSNKRSSEKNHKISHSEHKACQRTRTISSEVQKDGIPKTNEKDESEQMRSKEDPDVVGQNQDKCRNDELSDPLPLKEEVCGTKVDSQNQLDTKTTEQICKKKKSSSSSNKEKKGTKATPTGETSTVRRPRRISIKIGSNGELDLSLAEDSAQAEKMREAYEKWKAAQVNFKNNSKISDEEGRRASLCSSAVSRSSSRHRSRSKGPASLSTNITDNKESSEVCVTNDAKNTNTALTRARRSRSIGRRIASDVTQGEDIANEICTNTEDDVTMNSLSRSVDQGSNGISENRIRRRGRSTGRRQNANSAGDRNEPLESASCVPLRIATEVSSSDIPPHTRTRSSARKREVSGVDGSIASTTTATSSRSSRNDSQRRSKSIDVRDRSSSSNQVAPKHVENVSKEPCHRPEQNDSALTSNRRRCQSLGRGVGMRNIYKNLDHHDGCKDGQTGTSPTAGNEAIPLSHEQGRHCSDSPVAASHRQTPTKSQGINSSTLSSNASISRRSRSTGRHPRLHNTCESVQSNNDECKVRHRSKSIGRNGAEASSHNSTANTCEPTIPSNNESFSRRRSKSIGRKGVEDNSNNSIVDSYESNLSSNHESNIRCGSRLMGRKEAVDNCHNSTEDTCDSVMSSHDECNVRRRSKSMGRKGAEDIYHNSAVANCKSTPSSNNESNIHRRSKSMGRKEAEDNSHNSTADTCESVTSSHDESYIRRQSKSIGRKGEEDKCLNSTKDICDPTPSSNHESYTRRRSKSMGRKGAEDNYHNLAEDNCNSTPSSNHESNIHHRSKSMELKEAEDNSLNSTADTCESTLSSNHKPKIRHQLKSIGRKEGGNNSHNSTADTCESVTSSHDESYIRRQSKSMGRKGEEDKCHNSTKDTCESVMSSHDECKVRRRSKSMGRRGSEDNYHNSVVHNCKSTLSSNHESSIRCQSKSMEPKEADDNSHNSTVDTCESTLSSNDESNKLMSMRRKETETSSHDSAVDTYEPIISCNHEFNIRRRAKTMERNRAETYSHNSSIDACESILSSNHESNNRRRSQSMGRKRAGTNYRDAVTESKNEEELNSTESSESSGQELQSTRKTVNDNVIDNSSDEDNTKSGSATTHRSHCQPVGRNITTSRRSKSAGRPRRFITSDASDRAKELSKAIPWQSFLQQAEQSSRESNILNQ